jgi:hypothetical protein
MRKTRRNEDVYQAYCDGKQVTQIAREHNVSAPRIHQIIKLMESKMVHTKDIGIAICDGLEHVRDIERYNWRGQKGVVNMKVDPVQFELDAAQMNNLVIRCSDGSTFKVIIVNATE